MIDAEVKWGCPGDVCKISSARLVDIELTAYRDGSGSIEIETEIEGREIFNLPKEQAIELRNFLVYHYPFTGDASERK